MISLRFSRLPYTRTAVWRHFIFYIFSAKLFFCDAPERFCGQRSARRWVDIFGWTVPLRSSVFNRGNVQQFLPNWIFERFHGLFFCTLDFQTLVILPNTLGGSDLRWRGESPLLRSLPQPETLFSERRQRHFLVIFFNPEATRYETALTLRPVFSFLSPSEAACMLDLFIVCPFSSLR